MEFIKPSKLRKGDTVAIVTSSWGGPSVFPHIHDNGLRILREKFGLKIKEYPSARMDANKLKNNPKIRADDINAAFADKEVKAIFVPIGGDDSIRILKYLDKKVIMSNPKIFMGYSDPTTINTLLNQWGLITFNGPTTMCGFSQMENFPDFEKHVKELLFENPQSYEYKQYNEWSMKYLEWADKNNIGKVDKKRKNEGWHFIQGNGKVEGRLYGGCLDVLEILRGTEYWANKEFWKDKILFFETSEEKPTPSFVKYAMRNYGIQGILDNIKAIVIGRGRDYTPEETKTMEQNIIEVVANEFNHPEMPIITNVDFGHTDPQIILPLGIKAEIDMKKKTFRLLEKPLKD